MWYCESWQTLWKEARLSLFQQFFRLRDITWPRTLAILDNIAGAIQHIHGCQPPVVYVDLKAENVLLANDGKAKLIDFGCVTPMSKSMSVSTPGSSDPKLRTRDAWSKESDVFAFGIVLLLLITKGDFGVENGSLNSGAPSLGQWATSEYEQHNSSPDSGTSKFSLVHQSLVGDSEFYWSDAPEVTKVAVECMASNPTERPTMKQVVKRLSCMQVAQRHTDILGVEEHVSQWKAKLFSIMGCVGFLKD